MTVICVVYLFVDDWFLICKIEINRYFCISMILYTLCYGIKTWTVRLSICSYYHNIFFICYYLRCLCLFAHSGVQHILCCGFVFLRFCVPYVASLSVYSTTQTQFTTVKPLTAKLKIQYSYLLVFQNFETWQHTFVGRWLWNKRHVQKDNCANFFFWCAKPLPRKGLFNVLAQIVVIASWSYEAHLGDINERLNFDI